MTKTQTKTKSQTDRFKMVARELGCDESEEKFDDALKKIASGTNVKNRKQSLPTGKVREKSRHR